MYGPNQSQNKNNQCINDEQISNTMSRFLVWETSQNQGEELTKVIHVHPYTYDEDKIQIKSKIRYKYSEDI